MFTYVCYFAFQWKPTKLISLRTFKIKHLIDIIIIIDFKWTKHYAYIIRYYSSHMKSRNKTLE